MVQSTEDGNLEVTLDEAFLPHTLAVVDMESGDWNEDNTVSYTSHGSENFVAQYVEYDGTTYVGATASDFTEFFALIQLAVTRLEMQ